MDHKSHKQILIKKINISEILLNIKHAHCFSLIYLGYLLRHSYLIVGLWLCCFFFPGLKLVGCLAVSVLIELLSMWNLTKVELQLCNMLSPEEPPVSLDSYNWILVCVSKSITCSHIYLSCFRFCVSY